MSNHQCLGTIRDRRYIHFIASISPSVRWSLFWYSRILLENAINWSRFAYTFSHSYWLIIYRQSLVKTSYKQICIGKPCCSWLCGWEGGLMQLCISHLLFFIHHPLSGFKFGTIHSDWFWTNSQLWCSLIVLIFWIVFLTTEKISER